MPDHSIILMDDECALCTRFTRILVRFDKNDRFRITGLLTREGIQLQNLFGEHHVKAGSILLVESDKIYRSSDAVYRITLQLPGLRWLGILMKKIPFSLREKIYFFIARNRLRLFGQARKCSLEKKYVDKIFRNNVTSG